MKKIKAGNTGFYSTNKNNIISIIRQDGGD